MRVMPIGRRLMLWCLPLGLALAAQVPTAAQALVIEYFFNQAEFTDTKSPRENYSGTINGTFTYDLNTDSVLSSNITIDIFNATNQPESSSSSFTAINFSTFIFDEVTYDTLNFFEADGQVARFWVERSPDGSRIELFGAGKLNTSNNPLFGYCPNPTSPNFCNPGGQLVGADSFALGASIVPVPGPFSLLGLLPMGALASARRRLRRRYERAASGPAADPENASSTLS